MQRLPIGIQSFEELRKGGFLYIDKTWYIHKLATSNKYYFLSRPRRFGKSLLVSTLRGLFEGNRELFEGLWIENHWDWTATNPVILLQFNKASYKISGLEAALHEELERLSELFDVSLKNAPYPSQLEELIIGISQKHGKVVFLVDEYDKPIIDFLEDIPQAEANREILKNFYSVLKPLDAHLRMVFFTGVSKFSRVSIFSELNNLLDLTIHQDYATMLGYTQEELEYYFADRIEALASEFGDKEAFLQKIKTWYNGYTWDCKNYVYNPFSILGFFEKRQFQNFWFESGTPTFLVKLLNRQKQYDLEHIQVGPSAFNSFELNRLDPYTLLFQTGYVTMQSVDEDEIYTLSYPNKEVKDSLLQYLLAEYSHEFPTKTSVLASQMKNALQQDRLEDFAQSINALFASIPYQIIADKEAYYHSVIFLALSLMGSYIRAEVSQAKGRPDAVVHTKNCIYIIEFKLDESAELALQQIKDKNYASPYLGQDKPVKGLGIHFSSTQKGVDSWLMEEML